MNKKTINLRVLAVAPTTRGLGYAVFEGTDRILAFGTKKARGEAKNALCLGHVKKLAELWVPDVLALRDVHQGCARRNERIKDLHWEMRDFARASGITVIKLSGRQLRDALLNAPDGTKHQMATEIASRFPRELRDKLPRKRRAWHVEDERMSIFDAVALAVALTTRRRIRQR